MTKPIIFLDFDGVLNSYRSLLAHQNYGPPSWDSIAVCLIARLAKETDANVVISSSWRVGATLAELKEHLALHDVRLSDRVIDVTPRLVGPRGCEIKEWLESNPGKHNSRYVIIDDNSDMLDEQLRYFVQTSYRDGFGVPELAKALEILMPGADVARQAIQMARPHDLDSVRRLQALEEKEARG